MDGWSRHHRGRLEADAAVEEKERWASKSFATVSLSTFKTILNGEKSPPKEMDAVNGGGDRAIFSFIASHHTPLVGLWRRRLSFSLSVWKERPKAVAKAKNVSR